MKNAVKCLAAVLAGLITIGVSSDQTIDMSKQGLEQCLDKMAAALGGAHGSKEERKK
jgi:hypothetical protein